jgi:hypothetical protein
LGQLKGVTSLFLHEKGFSQKALIEIGYSKEAVLQAINAAKRTNPILGRKPVPRKPPLHKPL